MEIKNYFYPLPNLQVKSNIIKTLMTIQKYIEKFVLITETCAGISKK